MTIFSHFLLSYYNHINPKCLQCCKNMTINQLSGFVYGNYYKRVGFRTENSYYSMKR